MPSSPGSPLQILQSCLVVKAKAESLIPLLRDMYLTVCEDYISVFELEAFLAAAESPVKIISWCILFLCQRLQNFSPVDPNNLYSNAPYEIEELRCIWELVSKVVYTNLYGCIQSSESARARNRLQKLYGKEYVLNVLKGGTE